MTRNFAVVDLFAGPGGLAEGFSSIRDNGNRPFSVVLSVEKEASAHGTLLFRSFLRQFERGFPDEYYHFLNGKTDDSRWLDHYPREWETAERQTLRLELGTVAAREEIDQHLDGIRRKHHDDIILIGGPPCQAYSIVGRSRNKGIVGYEASKDKRHFLYREYIRILDRLRPAAFVMENVKGMLSSSVSGERVFESVLNDLCAVGGPDEGYVLIPLAPRSGEVKPGLRHPPPVDFVVRAEDFDLPQARHRVIVVGLRADIARRLEHGGDHRGLVRGVAGRVAVEDVLDGMPQLRSGLSQAKDSAGAWRSEVLNAMARVAKLEPRLPAKQTADFHRTANDVARRLRALKTPLPRQGLGPVGIGKNCHDALRTWLLDPRLHALPNNETRRHMAPDLARYFFAAVFAEVTGFSPKAADFPVELAPEHRNWITGKFNDRFRVQVGAQPSSTITSHIAKDGHYFIHPDPLQCRSLTVREAARLQTFPDNYLFLGHRTQQYIQVGNAVPPFLANKIARALYAILTNGHSRMSSKEIRDMSGQMSLLDNRRLIA